MLKDLLNENASSDEESKGTNKVEDSFSSANMVKQSKKVQNIPGVLGAVQGVVTLGAVKTHVQGFKSQADWVKLVSSDTTTETDISAIQKSDQSFFQDSLHFN
jgi:hypothetical protein